MMLCIMTLPLFAASNGDPVAMHVDYLKKYNPYKLSVVNFYGFLYMDDISCEPKSIVPAELDYIISINGQNTEEIDPANIYPILNGRDGKVTLRMHSIVQDTDYTLQYTTVNLNKRGFDETYENLNGVFVFSQANIDKAKSINLFLDENIADWSQYRKISVLLSSSDPLLEKEFAQTALEYLKQSRFPFIIDDEDPDLILKVSFDENESVTTTYVPQTTTYIDQGSNTYVTRGKYGIYVNSFKRSPKKITEGGYTHEDVSNRHFLEIALLDARKMLDPNQTVPPIVWQLRYAKQLDYKQSLRDASRNILKACRAFPGKDQISQPCVCWSGICWDENRPIVTDIYKGSPAEELGLQPGDKILKIDGKTCIEIKMKGWLNGKFATERTPISIPFKYRSIGKILTARCNDIKTPYCFQETVGEYQSNNPYYNYTELHFPDFLSPYHTTTVEIKRNGKKMKLTGHLYRKTNLFQIGNALK